MEKGRRINKKKLKECLSILILIVIVFILISIVRKTYSRYQSDASVNIKDLKIAFSILDNDLASELIEIEGIYPGNESYDYIFSVSNFKDFEIVDENNAVTSSDRKVAENAMEYDIIVKATTNLPLEYELYYGEKRLMSTIYNGGSITNTTFSNKLNLNTTITHKTVNYLNEERTQEIYYKEVAAYAANNSDELSMMEKENGEIIPETRTYTLRVKYPQTITAMVNNVVTQNVSIGEQFSDLVESVKLTIVARQKTK